MGRLKRNQSDYNQQENRSRFIPGTGEIHEGYQGKYSRGVKFWAMNESTYTDLMVEAMSINAAGAIVSAQGATMPVVGGDIVVLSDDIITDGNIIVGYGDLYLLAERAGSSFARSDEYRFADDQVAFKGTARYDGAPIIAEGFAAIGIGSAPATDATFPGDTANDTTLTDLSIGSLRLISDFLIRRRFPIRRRQLPHLMQ